nr:helix-turn-helix transcriptional regulator [Kibdelosporangium sp. MJ126-NF4]CEL16572.1 regulatory protein [Kibdelosporangium sp. MJ126-NF4]CTQ89078.1 regulatory protein [Kibdelosporangium sp. MJ126-NF4]
MAKRARLARTRKAAGLTQEQFAAKLNVDRTTVIRWEAGQHDPLPYMQPKMAGLLHVSQAELRDLLRPPLTQVTELTPTGVSGGPGGLALPQGGLWVPVVADGQPGFLPLDATALPGGRGADQVRSLPTDPGPDVGDRDHTLRAVVELSGEDLKRRNFLAGTAFTAAAFAEPALFAMTAPPAGDAARESGGTRIGMTDVQILADNLAHLRRMDFRYGSGRMRERAVQYLHHEATRLLGGSYSDATGRALLTAVAQCARMAASMAADTGLHTLAQRYYIQALNLAIEAGNRLFAATMLSDMARQVIQNATRQQDARQAASLARSGMTMAGKATPTLAAQLHAVEARAHALSRDSSAVRLAVADAETRYDRYRPDEEPQWLGFYTEAELAADLGRALRDIGESDRATRLLSRTLDGYEPWRVRSRCFVQTDLAAAYLVHDEHDRAVAVTRDALATASEVNSRRAVNRIEGLQRRMGSLDSAVLARLDEEIAEFLRRAREDEDVTA